MLIRIQGGKKKEKKKISPQISKNVNAKSGEFKERQGNVIFLSFQVPTQPSLQVPDLFLLFLPPGPWGHERRITVESYLEEGSIMADINRFLDGNVAPHGHLNHPANPQS